VATNGAPSTKELEQALGERLRPEQDGQSFADALKLATRFVRTDSTDPRPPDAVWVVPDKIAHASTSAHRQRC
jgi:hypothetical protein